MFEPRVRAVLGPTNTGKTHLAIERLLAHASGIIGFPLRLLARENYDRMVAIKGERQVALITGEEKIVPAEAKWFACTVEAMPLDRPVEFLAVDEIQLCADPDRGHVFTDRLLHARGMVETMFLGAETIAPLLRRLVPRAEIETRPRLSQLTYAGPAKLTRLPPRSAIVAFSAQEVYAIAEAVRRRRGGCAVVMGRLSPRTRNAQVALYQNREVDFLVATDAIGMGLNMDVDHVAFAALSKFDGQHARPLTAQEVAQIAGRAGRGMKDGSFGTTAECPPMPEEIVEAVETHAFEPLQALAWRNSDLDFTSVDALLGSLAAPPPAPGLAKGHDAVDHITLEALSRDPEVRGLADTMSRVRLLWESCQVPDFRKLADDSHTKLCAKIFTHLAREGRLPRDWVANAITVLERTDGDLDTLMARITAIRVWAYIAARADWLEDAASLQAEARRVEDLISDALHETLTARFVDRRAAHLIRKMDESEEELLSAVTRRGEVVVEGHPVGHVKGFSFEPDPGAVEEEERRVVLRAARRALGAEIPRRVAMLEAAKDEAFALTPNHRITWAYSHAPNMPAGLGDIAEVARLKPGPEPAKPQVEVLPSEFLDGAQRERIRERLATWLENHIKRELGAVFAAEAKAAEDNTLRGPAFRLREELGLAMGRTVPEIRPDLRQKLKGIGIRAGRYALFVPEAMKPRAMALRAQLWSLLRGIETPKLPGGGLIAIPPPEDWPRGFAETMGWLPAGAVLLRLDVAERIAGELGHLTRKAPAMLPGDLASRLGVKAEVLGQVLDAMGFRLVPAETLEEGVFGPPCPARIAHARPPRQEHHRGPRRDGPRQDQNRGPRREDRRPPRQDRPADAPAAAGEQPPAGTDAPRPPRQDQRPHRDQRPRHGQGGKGGPPGGDRDRGPRRPREERVSLPPMPRPDSPFAVLANLLKKG
ncbi:ATP-dependent RNA helicase SUPV3L1/SUV3 [Roseomonas alkaliterrae]|uniref:ATP-dependent RNA helicase SUPV3L1/SUV3 n=2 Tax=Neoroseomonas alkaliterrae TaxID=1452450 RepID=A0A840XLL2_9PROT|nr:helicase-related protein [Neoroseomonas alkaliterrae]MBB5689495.1 ATP-dependent RNA helicase SUPV3L1/SUV3 [Neoroseomonas alkaliterrae]